MTTKISMECGDCGAPNPGGKTACYACGRVLVPAPTRKVSGPVRISDGISRLRGRWPALCALAVGVLAVAIFLSPINPLGPANLERAALYGKNLAGARLRGANLRSANLTQANLTGADLAGARLTGAQLAGARLARADLSRTEMDGVDLTGADLAGANMANASLANSQLTDANLQGANLTGVNLQGAFFNRKTRWPAGFDPAAHGAGMVE